MAESSALLIEELTGENRRLELRGAGLPLRGASWAGEQNVKTTWYPGNVEATQQVLGPQESPSDWEGEWNRTRLGKTPCLFTDGQGTTVKVVDPAFLWDVMDDFRIRGAKLRVTWSVVDGSGTGRASRTREGRLQRFEAMPDTAYDVRWKAKFEWSGRGGAQQKVIATRDGDMAAAVQALTAAQNALTAAAERARLVTTHAKIAKAPSSLTLGQLEQLAQFPTKLVSALLRPVQKATSDLQKIGEIVKTVRAIPFSTANAGLQAARDAVAVANQFHDALSRRPAELNTTRNEVSALTRAAAYFWGTQDRAVEFAGTAHEVKRRLAAAGRKPNDTTVRRTVEIHVVKQGDTLPALSQRYYGTPDRAADIARANRLPWHQVRLNLGRTLVIPLPDTNRQSG